MKYLFLWVLLIGQAYAQTKTLDSFYTLEIKIVDSFGDALIMNGKVLIRDTMSNYSFYVATDSAGFAKVVLPANRVYELTSMMDDHYDSRPVLENLNSDNRKTTIVNEQWNILIVPPFTKFNRVFFEKGKSDISPEMKIVLDSFCNAVSLYKNRIMIFEVRGNTRMSKDDKGDFELSELRAKAVADYLKHRTFNCEFIPSAQSHYRLKNECSDKRCSEKEYLENDRVEIHFVASRKN